MTGRPRNSPASFWKRVAVGAADACWPWLKSTKNGYGRFTEGYAESYAHRRAWELTHGGIPESMCVMHRCNNKVCCNPKHLQLGTTQQNTLDAYRDGLAVSGERHPRAKLTTADVIRIRKDPRTQVSIARAYGVRQTTISRIKLNQNWKHEGADER